jgi:hypothetical protein
MYYYVIFTVFLIGDIGGENNKELKKFFAHKSKEREGHTKKSEKK